MLSHLVNSPSGKQASRTWRITLAACCDKGWKHAGPPGFAVGGLRSCDWHGRKQDEDGKSGKWSRRRYKIRLRKSRSICTMNQLKSWLILCLMMIIERALPFSWDSLNRDKAMLRWRNDGRVGRMLSAISLLHLHSQSHSHSHGLRICCWLPPSDTNAFCPNGHLSWSPWSDYSMLVE